MYIWAAHETASHEALSVFFEAAFCSLRILYRSKSVFLVIFWLFFDCTHGGVINVMIPWPHQSAFMARIYFHVQSGDFYSLATSSGNGSVYSSEPRATLEAKAKSGAREKTAPPRNGGGGGWRHGHDLVASNKRKKERLLADEKNSQKANCRRKKSFAKNMNKIHAEF